MAINPSMHAFSQYNIDRDYSTTDISHHYLHSQHNLSYGSMDEMLNGREPLVLVFPDIAPALPLFDNWPRPWAADWYYEPALVTDVALAEDGSILLFDRLGAGRQWQPDTLEPNRVSEIVKIPTTHRMYRLALERVNTLLPGIQAGRGFVRLDIPLEGSWPFVDYDVARFSVYDSGIAFLAQHFARSETAHVRFEIRPFDDELLPSLTAAPSFLPRFFALADDNALLFVEVRQDQRGQGRPQSASVSVTIWRMERSHTHFAAARAEVLRLMPELEPGSGFAQFETELAAPGWPFIPLPEAMDGMIDRRAAAGEWYQPDSAGPQLSRP